ncbi:MAG: hypothetical protein MUP16_02960 [Sedimentisphaerales bacterium]|nr:hypothetical protein [Sedimentisphaerales bacterium]
MKGSSEPTKRRSRFIPLAFFAVAMMIVVPTLYYCQRPHKEKGGMKILGHRYSDNLKDLYEKVIELHNKPIKIVERTEKGNNTIDTSGSEIILTLGRGCSEDNIAHELMHAILQAEHYPGIFGVNVFPLSHKLRALCCGDLDHLVINDRLLDLGYDPHAGFLSHAEGYENVLRLNPTQVPGAQAVHRFGLLHELIKFHYYIEDPNAERDILAKFPGVERYWRLLSRKIDSLPSDPKPRDLWDVGARYLGLGDEIAKDVNAPFLISDLLGMGPLLLHPSDLAKSAQSMFELTTQTLSDQHVLVHIFTVSPRVMVHCFAVPPEHLPPKSIGRLSVRDYLQGLGIEFDVLE